MKKMGFTLIELLAVIVVLAIILAVAIPSISGIINSSAKSSMQSDVKLLLNAIDLKKLENNAFDPTIYNSDLSGLLTTLNLNGDNYESVIFNEHNGKMFVTVTGKAKWEGFTACGTYHNMEIIEGECTLDFVPPVITLNGDSTVVVHVGESYTELGATAADNKDGNITANLNTSGSVDVNTIGLYEITYTVTDTSGNSTTVTRMVNVVDSTPPVITLIGMSPTTVFVGMTYVDEGATALDNLDGNVSANIVTLSNVNTSIEGSYTVTYNVDDSVGNDAVEVVRVVMVKNPIFTFTNASATGNSGPTQTQLDTAYAGTSLEGAVTSSSGIQLWTVPVTGNYTIEAKGAQGGRANNYLSGATGAVIKGTFALTEGTQLKILVGQQGNNQTYSGGGGGGTFVATSTNTPLIVAGGGAGGSGQSSGLNSPTMTTSGNAGHGNTTTWKGGAGGTNGSGGAVGYASSGGGGFTGAGGGGVGGQAFINGGVGGGAGSNGGAGGFGGGGGASGSGGGGGGYSGGGGGGWIGSSWGSHCSGGGGGSYNAGTNQSNTAYGQSGHGQVVITFIP